ncbi:MAG: hypothetical protein GF334_08725 [Candidatus Altiarchaeales archaeon]|nr:hypothetical protein [Candidatus Altiarchaeales archaeon]
MKLRLLLLTRCNRDCEGCCNKQWDLAALPQVKTFIGYEQILLTGGEPLLDPMKVIRTCVAIRQEAGYGFPIYLYTAWSKDIVRYLQVINSVEGIVLTLHQRHDLDNFRRLQEWFRRHPHFAKMKSLRLNVFSEVGEDIHDDQWKVKNNVEWIENCPLPTDEVFMRL